MTKYPVYDDLAGARRGFPNYDLRGYAATEEEAIQAGERFYRGDKRYSVLSVKLECVERASGEKVKCWILTLEADINWKPISR